MIHSLAGGNIGNEQFFDFALVEINSSFAMGKFWYISKIKELSTGDNVEVPYGTAKVNGRVLRIDRNVSSFSSPVPVKRAKIIIKKL